MRNWPLARVRWLGWSLALLWCLFSLVAAGKLHAQEDDEEEAPPPAGFAAEYKDDDGNRIERHDPRLAFHWPGKTPPDARLVPGKFQARWKANIALTATGTYRFSLFAAGDVSLQVAGKQILSGGSDQPRWFEAEPIELTFGEYPIEITYARRGADAQIALYWSGPGFGLEPITARWLSHSAEHAPNDAIFQRGRELTRSLRCGACHEMPEPVAVLPGPALDRLAGNVEPAWLLKHLTSLNDSEPDDQDGKPNQLPARKMPGFKISPAEAQAIASYLYSASTSAATEESIPATKPTADQIAAHAVDKTGGKEKKSPEKPPAPDKRRGERLLLSLGCLACHQVNELGTPGLFSGGDLTAIAAKRPADFFARWLQAPQAINRDHRMPLFPLSDEEVADLALYLATIVPAAEAKEEAEVKKKTAIKKSASSEPSAEVGKHDTPISTDKGLIAQGQKLVEQFRCAACHRLPENAKAVPRVAWTTQATWDKSCLLGEGENPLQPRYQLSVEDRWAVHSYFQAMPAREILQPRADDRPVEIDVAWLLRERNCLNCHQRELQPGLTGIVADVVAGVGSNLAPLAPALVPPSLESVGDKLQDAALKKALTAEAPIRPWLLVRMPHFQFSQEEESAIMAHLIAEDRIPPRPAPKEKRPVTPLDPQIVRMAGGRLVTADGFGCTSCHQIGQTRPVKVELNAIGPDISQLARRIRPTWFDRWVRDPIRIVPRMEMPAIKQPVAGVLNHELAPQLAAVWEALNLPDFTPPEPNPIRILRRHNVAAYGEPTTWLTDNLEFRGKTFVKPLLLALPNRHNVLFDQERQRLAGWWLGDAASQRTRGKYWYWQTAGTNIIAPDIGEPELQLIQGERLISPQIDAAFPPAPDELRHLLGNDASSGVSFDVRLQYPAGNAPEPLRQIRVRQQFFPVGFTRENIPQAITGFTRQIDITGLAADSELQLRLLPAGVPVVFDARRKLATLDQPVVGKVLIKTPGLEFAPGKDCQLRLKAGPDGTTQVVLHYFTEKGSDQFFLRPRDDDGFAAKLEVAPGWTAERLGLSPEIMPISLAWRRDGRLLIGSLKNRVWQAIDIDGDGLEDRIRQVGDEFVQPYGLATQIADSGQEVIDVLDKTALHRLYDEDQDNYFERSETLVDGWGHSTDYHGWMVGLPRDEKGNYYAALSQRDGPAAHLRGQALKLSPRVPAAENPRRFALESLAWGLRFPAGIARNAAGELFVTDNQGQYNAWNELNQIFPGRHFGYINSHDPPERSQQAKRGPTIAIPHPWTRSVNGICFLETPPAVRERTGKNVFGPFEGHLVGCEYDTRRLVRISLHHAGDRIEGASYPLTLTPGPEQDLSQWLLGPIVCQVSPQGDLYVGGIRDSAYGGGNNTGEIVRLRFTGDLPPGIAEMRRVENGWEIDFTAKIDRERLGRVENYELISARRVSTPAYGGPDLDRRTERILNAEARDDGRGVTLRLEQLRPGHVYELQVKNLLPEGELFFPAEAYYSLGPIP